MILRIRRIRRSSLFSDIQTSVTRGALKKQDHCRSRQSPAEKRAEMPYMFQKKLKFAPYHVLIARNIICNFGDNSCNSLLKSRIWLKKAYSGHLALSKETQKCSLAPCNRYKQLTLCAGLMKLAIIVCSKVESRGPK